MKSLICLSLILLPLFSVVEGQGIGSPTRKEVDEEVVVLALFAVSEHNRRSKANLVYINVLQETMQVVHGLLYRLIISAENDSRAAKNYEAVVWEKPQGQGNHSNVLVSFKECKSVAFVNRLQMYECTPMS
ncbi:unnamed protein product [Brassica rapa]|uniref:Cystatin domain-containing protein n=2 Tax=Brassica TaxID=3705 RepID=A0A3P5ZNP4_BRACM|nr:unnamed protein product [Brassica napus]CAG7882973.1 unnamed protein product [Brassica rapa]VDC82216.1 unnamed protein product [Brassica rapa]